MAASTFEVIEEGKLPIYSWAAGLEPGARAQRSLFPAPKVIAGSYSAASVGTAPDLTSLSIRRLAVEFGVDLVANANWEDDRGRHGS